MNISQSKPPAPAEGRAVDLLARRWLSSKSFEIEVSRPPRMHFQPGQYMRIGHHGCYRDYTAVTAPDDPSLKFCIRHLPQGELSRRLAELPIGERLDLEGPMGYFVHQPSSRKRLCVATGSGIAPFVAMARAGQRTDVLLHGARRIEDLYYRDWMQRWADLYVPCVTGSAERMTGTMFPGRVTDYLSAHLGGEGWDIYVCGLQVMIRDVIRLADERFPGCPVFTESFY